MIAAATLSSLPVYGHELSELAPSKQYLESLHRLECERENGRVARRDRRARELKLEADFRLRRSGLSALVSETKTKREWSSMPGWKRISTQRCERVDHRGGSSKFGERHELDDQRKVASQPTRCFVQIDIDADIHSRRVVEEQVGTACGVALPPTLELMTRGLLQPGQLPAADLDALADDLYERLEREDRFTGSVTHDESRVNSPTCRFAAGFNGLTPFPPPP